MATKYGYLGVNLFFLISGFVILFSAFNKSSLEFAISRIDRLYPAYWVAVTLTAVTAVIFTDSRVSTIHYLMNLTMINDYFNIPSMDGIYWTLHVELKFYFLVVVLILAKQIKNVHIWIPLWLATTTSYLMFEQPFFMGWFINPYYSPYFISGILFHLIYLHGVNWQRLTELSVSFLISVYYSVDQADGFIIGTTMGNKIVAPILVVCMYLLFLAIATRKLTIKGSDVLITAGGLTYSVYLLHARIGKTLYDILSANLGKYISLIMVTIFIIVLSFALYTFVEKRFSGQIKSFMSSILPNGSL
jgi:peptidoglycan/LPS O-acetylase OafA/YrhL